jgi:hypothetical protein
VQKIHPSGCADVVDCAANPRNVFVYSIGVGRNAAMDLAIRELTVDELERVVGGDAPVGTTATDNDMCTAMTFKVGGVTVLAVTHSCESL